MLVALVTDSGDCQHFSSSMRTMPSFLEGFVGDSRVKAARAAVAWSRKLIIYDVTL